MISIKSLSDRVSRSNFQPLFLDLPGVLRKQLFLQLGRGTMNGVWNLLCSGRAPLYSNGAAIW